ncbi:MAG: acylphosphatase [Rhodospirillaceae bacterium]|nr:acylphosphatase [Rhodospirillaceae bacterium]|tara:strand:- start:302 stop:574 length:273 start_codon:yes stop_codon:yes gene_type:complete
MSRAVRVIISGRVQGVGFRYWTEREANKLALDGWVRNLPDGTVEALFAGSDEGVATMVQRCHEGPRFASVKNVESFEADVPTVPGFTQYR